MLRDSGGSSLGRLLRRFAGPRACAWANPTITAGLASLTGLVGGGELGTRVTLLSNSLPTMTRESSSARRPPSSRNIRKTRVRSDAESASRRPLPVCWLRPRANSDSGMGPAIIRSRPRDGRAAAVARPRAFVPDSPPVALVPVRPPGAMRLVAARSHRRGALGPGASGSPTTAIAGSTPTEPPSTTAAARAASSGQGAACGRRRRTRLSVLPS